MRISTSQFYQHGLNALLVQQARTAKLQEQLATGLRVQSASDDPVRAAQIELMVLRLGNIERYEHNGQAAKEKLQFEESLISSTVSSLQELRDLQITAGNSAMSEADRKTLATKVTNILGQLQDMANYKDPEGYYMFSGSKGATPAISLDSLGKYVYNGDSLQRYQALSDTLQIAMNDTADNVFMNNRTGNGTFTINPTAVTNTGTGVLSSGAVVNPSAYVPDNYTLSFAENSQGQLVVLVNGATSGSVIPPSGVVDDAPLYQEGAGISFNGMEIKVTGLPAAGDEYAISPSRNDSIFSTLQEMITTLNQPFTTSADKAQVQTKNNQLLEQIDSALNHMLGIQSDIGNRLNHIELVNEANGDIKEISTATLKSLREIDPTLVATEFNTQLINLQAAQQSFVRIQGLSVFNYI